MSNSDELDLSLLEFSDFFDFNPQSTSNHSFQINSTFNDGFQMSSEVIYDISQTMGSSHMLSAQSSQSGSDNSRNNQTSNFDHLSSHLTSSTLTHQPHTGYPLNEKFRPESPLIHLHLPPQRP